MEKLLKEKSLTELMDKVTDITKRKDFAEHILLPGVNPSKKLRIRKTLKYATLHKFCFLFGTLKRHLRLTFWRHILYKVIVQCALLAHTV